MTIRKVGLVAPHYPPYLGGVETHVQHLAEGLAQSGFVVDVLTQSELGASGSHETVNGVEVIRFPLAISSLHYAVSPSLYRALLRERMHYDLFHAHSYHALPALAASMAHCRPLVFTPHYMGTGFSIVRKMLHPPYRLLGRQIFASARAVICVSEPERGLLARDFPGGEAKFVVIPNGVDEERILAAPRLDVTGPLLLSASRLERYKRVDQLVAAFAQLPAEWVMTVAGDGPARADLVHLSETLGVASRVNFVGNVPAAQLYSWLRTARVMASMSSNEAMPVVVVEALAAGTPVVLSRIPAHEALAARWPDAVTLAEPEGRTEELTQKILLAAQLERPRVVVPSWKDVVEQTIRVYSSVAAA